jgi:DNA recombination protein RmuC
MAGEAWLLIIALAVLAMLAVLVWNLSRQVQQVRQNSAQDASLGLIQKDILNLQQTVNDRLERSSIHMNEAMSRQFAASSRLISEVTRDLTELKASNKQVLSIADELKTLQNTLQNPKQRGVLGEYFLQNVLENVLPPERFSMQYKFNSGEIVDAVIRLDRGLLLPVDSKFSLENYNRLIDEKDKNVQTELLRSIRLDLKNRIDETSKYIRPHEGTMDFAFMFIPSEAIYYDLLVGRVGALKSNARDLIEYAYRERHVVIVSPTSFMAYLQTVIQGLRSLQIEEKAKDIQRRVAELSRHIGAHETYMQKLGSALGVTVGHYNVAHRELKKMDTDVVKIAGTVPQVEPSIIDKPSDSGD